jgi:hypothetical protein
MYLTLEKTKNKVCLRGYFYIFTLIFWIITRVMGVFRYFTLIFLFLNQKCYRCVLSTQQRVDGVRAF